MTTDKQKQVIQKAHARLQFEADGLRRSTNPLDRKAGEYLNMMLGLPHRLRSAAEAADVDSSFDGYGSIRSAGERDAYKTVIGWLETLK